MVLILMRVPEPDEQIRATVDVLKLDEGLTKVRVVVWSGPDFKWPHLVRGGLFEEPAAAAYVADKAVEALELLGIPITAGLQEAHEPAEPLLRPTVEGQEYPRLD